MKNRTTLLEKSQGLMISLKAILSGLESFIQKAAFKRFDRNHEFAKIPVEGFTSNRGESMKQLFQHKR